VSVSSTGSQRVKIEQNSVAPLRPIRASALIRHCAGHDRDPAVADQKRLPPRHGQELRFAVDSPLEGAVTCELVSVSKFPVSRENTGNFTDSELSGASTRAKKAINSVPYEPIPYASEQGIFWGLARN
jgi:hypothetical protein